MRGSKKNGWIGTFSLLSTLIFSSCVEKSAVQNQKQRALSLAFTLPKLPPRLLGDTWLAPFQVNLLFEGPNGFIERRSFTQSTSFDLVVPIGSLRVRASYLGFELPNTLGATALCSDYKPNAIYAADSDQMFNTGLSSELVISFSPPRAIDFAEFGVTVNKADGTPATGAIMSYNDPLTNLPITGPCSKVPSDTANEFGKMRGGFPNMKNGVIKTSIAYGGAVTPLIFQLSNDKLQNFFTVNLGTKTFAIDPPTADFDSDGKNNQEEIVAGTNPYEAGTWGNGGSNETFSVQAFERGPREGANGVSIGTNVVLRFTRSVNSSTLPGRISLVNMSAGNSVVNCLAFHTSWEKVVCKPASLLAPGSQYAVVVSPGISSTDGATLNERVEWSFATGENTPLALSTEYIWPNRRDSRGISKFTDVGVGFSSPLDITKVITATLVDATTGTPIPNTNCSYNEEVKGEDSQNGYIRCAVEDPATHEMIPLVPGKRYRLTVAGGAVGVSDNFGNKLMQNVRHEFTVFNNPSDTGRPAVTRYVPAHNDTAVRQDTVFGAFFDEPVVIDDWNLGSPNSFYVRNAAGVMVGFSTCRVYQELNGFICRAMEPLAVGNYSATLKSTAVTDRMGNSPAADLTWNFSVVATDTTQFVRVFEHPINALSQLTNLTVLAVFNHEIDTMSTSSQSMTLSGISTPTPAPSTNGYNGQESTLDSYGYIAYRLGLFHPGSISVSHNMIKDKNGSPATNPGWTINSSIAPVLKIVDRIPVPSEVVSRYSPIMLTFNRALPAAISATGTEMTSSVKLRDASGNDIPLQYKGYVNGFTHLVKFEPTAPLIPGAGYRVDVLQSGALASIAADESFSFTVQSAASETNAIISHFYPTNSHGEAIEGSDIGVQFDRAIYASQPAGVFEVCEMVAGAAQNCISNSAALTAQTNPLETGSSLSWRPTTTYGKVYKVTLKNIKEKSGASWAAGETFSWIFEVNGIGCTTCGGSHPTEFLVDSFSSYPQNNQTGVTEFSNIAISFNDEVDTNSLPGKISIVKTSNNSVIGCSAIHKSWNMLYCSPTGGLEPNANYQVNLSAGISSTNGTALASPVSWSFTTRATPSTRVALMVDQIWPNNRDEISASKFESARVQFNRPLNVGSIMNGGTIKATLHRVLPDTILGANCSYHEEGWSESRFGVIQCNPLDSGSSNPIEFTPGATYSIRVAGGAGGVVDNFNTPLLQDTRGDFTIFNLPNAAISAPAITRHVPADGALSVRQDTLFGAFFNRPVRIGMWGNYQELLTVKNGAGETMSFASCNTFQELNGFLCRRTEPLPVGSYTATLNPNKVSDSLGNAFTTAQSWSFSVVATDTTQFARVFEHPVGPLSDLTTFAALAVFNREIDGTFSNSNSLSIPLTDVTPSPYDSMGWNNWQGPAFDNFGYQMFRDKPFNPGSTSATLSNIRSKVGLTQLPSVDTSWFISASTVPPLRVKSTFPVEGSTISKFSAILVKLNRSISVSSTGEEFCGADGVSGPVKILTSIGSLVPCIYDGYKPGSTGFTDVIKIRPAASIFSSGETYKLRLEATGPLIGMTSFPETSFSISASEGNSLVTYNYPVGSVCGTSMNVGADLDRDVAANQPAGVIELCENNSGTVENCQLSPAMSSVGSYPTKLHSSINGNFSSLIPGKIYRATLKNIVERDGTTTWASSNNHSWEFSITSSTCP